jgi:tRNA dimethylallyltransferase
MNKIVVITGPTATGKTALGVRLAKKFNGEIISADSRQVYKYLDVGTGKDKSEYKDVPVWGLDLVEPDYKYNVSEFVDYANKKITEILERNKLPIVVGGTGQYIKELFWPSETLHIPQDKGLRESLNRLSVEELQLQLQEISFPKWETMNVSDRQNPRRLIRAIEVCKVHKVNKVSKVIYEPLIIGLAAPPEILDKRICERVEKRWPLMPAELESLKVHKVSKVKAFGYQGETLEEWKQEEIKYARRQIRYLAKMIPKIFWLDITNKNLLRQVENMVQNYLNRGNQRNGNQKSQSAEKVSPD